MKIKSTHTCVTVDRPTFGPNLDLIIGNEMERRAQNPAVFVSGSNTYHAVVGRCVDAAHPVLIGRILVHWEICENTFQQWLPTLHGMTFRKGDRVLIQFPFNSDEPIVAGVVDGFAKRPDLDRAQGTHLTLENDESIKVFSNDGTGLLEIFQTGDGPVLTLLSKDTHLSLPGKLRLHAEDIELNATQGGVKIAATDDVVVQGEEIRLN